MNNKYDTHVHTAETSPCGVLTAQETVQLYKDSGYSGIFITDHYTQWYFEGLSGNWSGKINNYLQGYKNALTYGTKIGLKVMLGVELRLVDSANEYLIYGLTEEVLIENACLYNLSLSEVKKLVASNGGLVFQAHPFRPNMVPANPAYLDGVEVYNGNPRHDSKNNLAKEYAEKNKLMMISGSDCHQIDDVARGGIITENPISGFLDFVETFEKQSYKMIMTI